MDNTATQISPLALSILTVIRENTTPPRTATYITTWSICKQLGVAASELGCCIPATPYDKALKELADADMVEELQTMHYRYKLCEGWETKIENPACHHCQGRVQASKIYRCVCCNNVFCGNCGQVEPFEVDGVTVGSFVCVGYPHCNPENEKPRKFKIGQEVRHLDGSGPFKTVAYSPGKDEYLIQGKTRWVSAFWVPANALEHNGDYVD